VAPACPDHPGTVVAARIGLAHGGVGRGDMARYGQTFKERVMARLLPPESAAVGEVSNKVGISVATPERWRAEWLTRRNEEWSRSWTAAAWLEVVIATAVMNGPPEASVPRARRLSNRPGDWEAGCDWRSWRAPRDGKRGPEAGRLCRS
jgi:hypothetical protein